MRQHAYTVLLIMLMVAFRSANAQEGCITVRVSDESGQIISNAVVSAGFGTMMQPGTGWGAGAENIVKGFTDTNGICVLTGEGNGGCVGVAVQKDGYYGSGGFGIDFTNNAGIAFKKWQPWNPTIAVVLRKIINPVPMYARWCRDIVIPEEGKELGFDLENGDWVSPFGKGENADILFRLDRKPDREVMGHLGNKPRPRKLRDITLTVSFPNDGDGIQSVLVQPRGGQSDLRLPAVAPASGYTTNVIKRIYDSEEEGKSPYYNIREDQNYFFRVRTKMDDKGNIVSSLHGKIHGDFDDIGYGKLTFKYYLNPTPNDRNLEFDPTKNLFKNLKSMEQVKDP